MGGLEHLQLKERAQVLVHRAADEKPTLLREDLSEDDLTMARFGKRQQLLRRFNLFTMLSLTYTIMGTWEGTFFGLLPVFINGGPSALWYGIIFIWIGGFSTALTMGEMGSMIPLAGGQYHWVALLAPAKSSKFLSYMSGWLTIIAWQANAATGFYGFGSLVQGMVIQCFPDYDPKIWQLILMAYASICIAVFINVALVRFLPHIESFVLIFSLAGFVAVITTLAYFAPHATPDKVFNNFVNQGGWETQGLSMFVGIATGVNSFNGVEGSCHMAEELRNAATAIPRSMIASVALNGVLALATITTILFCMGDVNNALNTPTGWPVIEIFYQAVGSNAGAVALTALIVFMVFMGTVGVMAGGSRMMWAFAREKGMPGHSYLSRIEPRTRIPLYTIGVSALIAVLVNLIPLGSSVAFQMLLSLQASAAFSSYCLCACVFLHKRLTDYDGIKWGPFRMGRWTGTLVNLYMVLYCFQGVFFSFWPVYKHVTIDTVNWSPVVWVGAVILALVCWFAHGRYVYKGPIIEVHLE